MPEHGQPRRVGVQEPALEFRAQHREPLPLGRGEPDLVAAVEDGVGDEAAHGAAEHGLRRAVAVHQVVLGQAQHELGERGICINYMVDDARRDVETVRRRLGK